MLRVAKSFESFSILLIVFIVLLFYSAGVDIFFFDEEWCEFLLIEKSRKTFYVEFNNTGGHLASIRPTKYLFYDALYQLFGPNPIPYRAFAILVHTLNAVLIFFLAVKFTGNKVIGLVTALFFASFWLDPESVTWLRGVHEVLWASFGLGAIIFFLCWRHGFGIKYYIFAIIACLLAFGSKENACVSLPVLIFLAGRYCKNPDEIIRNLSLNNLVTYLPFFTLGACYAVALRFTHIWKGYLTGTDAFTPAKFQLGFHHAITYVFSFPLIDNFAMAGVASLCLVAVAFIISPTNIRQHLSFLMLCEVVLLLPVAGLSGIAPRYLYFPSAFASAIIAIALYQIFLAKEANIKRWIGATSFFLICFVLLSFNCYYVSKNVEFYGRTGKVAKTFFDSIVISYPKGTDGLHIYLVNFPCILGQIQDSRLLAMRQMVWDNVNAPFLVYFGKDWLGPVFLVTLLEVWDGSFSLLSSKNISPAKLENLMHEKGNRVYFFNSKDDSIHDVTGKDYTFLTELINGN